MKKRMIINIKNIQEKVEIETIEIQKIIKVTKVTEEEGKNKREIIVMKRIRIQIMKEGEEGEEKEKEKEKRKIKVTKKKRIIAMKDLCKEVKENKSVKVIIGFILKNKTNISKQMIVKMNIKKKKS